MEFFDCNCYFGFPAKLGKSPKVCRSVDDLLSELNRAGIGRAIAWHVAQRDVSPQRGNELLSEAIREHPVLLGCWTMLPAQTGEMPVDKLLADMKTHRIIALRAFPAAHRYLLNELTMGGLLTEMTARHIPLLYSAGSSQPGVGQRQAWQELYDLLDDFPELTVIITDHGSWGSDRYFRPLLENCPNVYVDTALYFLDGGIEDFVATYGPTRMVYGSGLPERFPGGMMLAIRHGQIPEEAKTAIAVGNLTRIIEEVQL